jgi:glutamyl-tRNA synthetase/glutamyl-Q tRNA(Asp) synthetase
VITRFAPAPTGFLHLGHVVNAIHVWDAAKAREGRVLLRIEDHDRQRCRPEYEAALVEDLAWLGFEADGPLVRQSERDEVYRKALQPLIDRELVYGCTCTRTDLMSGSLRQGSGQAGLGEPGSEIRYPNTCGEKNIPLTDDVGWRLRIEPGVERFFDEIRGPQQQDPSEQCGDLLLRDRLGNWTYQFAATVDDHVQGITDVIRGVDLLPSTGRQIRLARLLGRPTPPRFAHHALVMKSVTEKLSKSDGDTGVRDLRAAGCSAEIVLNRARAFVTAEG